MLHVIIADSELELVPANIRSHPCVKNNAQRRGRPPKDILLDSSLHHSALVRLDKESAGRRGRPDIVHQCMNISQDSIAVGEGIARLVIHTRNDDVIEVDSGTRPPRSYNRFIGLLEKLLAHSDGVTQDPEGNVLIRRYQRNLPDLAQDIAGPKAMIVLLDEDSERIDSTELFGPRGIGSVPADDVVVVIGGFPHGGFLSKIPASWRRMALHDSTLTATACLAEVLVSWRLFCK